MVKANEVGVVIALLGIALGFGAGVLLGRVAAQLVEEGIARVVTEPDASAASRSVADVTLAQVDDVTRYKVPVTRSQPSRGPSDALVTIIEWCDLYGEACRQTDALLSTALTRHPRELRRVFRHLAASKPDDEQAHEVARVAFQQGRFWELRKRLSQLDDAPSLPALQAHARAAGLDWDAAGLALERLEHASYIAAERSLARALDVRHAPVLFINGRRVEGELSSAQLEALIDEELQQTRVLVASGAPRGDVYAEIIKPGVWQTRDDAL